MVMTPRDLRAKSITGSWSAARAVNCTGAPKPVRREMTGANAPTSRFQEMQFVNGHPLILQEPNRGRPEDLARFVLGLPPVHFRVDPLFLESQTESVRGWLSLSSDCLSRNNRSQLKAHRSRAEDKPSKSSALPRIGSCKIGGLVIHELNYVVHAEIRVSKSLKLGGT